MFRSIIKNQYIGKSQLNYMEFSSGYNYPEKTLIGKVFKDLYIPGLNSKKFPDLYLNGNYITGLNPYKNGKDLFDIDTPYPKHSLYITGIPLDCKDLEDYRLTSRIWESYYQDDYRGYLFQILPYNQFLITENESKSELEL